MEGDFTAEVKFLGDFQPGTVSSGLNFTFQVRDSSSGVTMTTTFGLSEPPPIAYTVSGCSGSSSRACRDGKATEPKRPPLKVREGAVTLRLERRGNAINYTYSLDGKTWLKLDHSSTNLPSKVNVGISATNASPRLPARFTDFVLKPAS